MPQSFDGPRPISRSRAFLSSTKALTFFSSAISVLSSWFSFLRRSSSVSGLLFFFGLPIPDGLPRFLVMRNAANPSSLYVFNHAEMH